MALWRDDFHDTTLAGEGIRLRHPGPDDYEAWAKLRGASRNHTQGWEPAWADDELTRTAYKRRLRRYQQDLETGQGYPFFIFRASDNVLVGACNLNNVRRGVLQAADIGYWIGLPYVRRGHARAAVRRVVTFAFGPLGLNRVEAATRPENEASRSLLLSVGFSPEGYARNYLKINGEWRDHLKFAIVRGDLLR
ncbi:MAG: GNAT family N-acetyltransferase [Oceanicaulis sp.]|uniref:GNAT family N-acetyltransferase n=1 Tax=Glycocaulis sp. TaxID=1969725 RepID=UPI0025BFAD44|nr:GNAT family protein [Glycocaulis sp.]MCC5980444.1 GNAT family N-acetyltransferase [Oceanicaulis sp.]MCH8520304.1 GNAT family N-acetyltransferase [Glycocaulis sp.]